MAEPGQRFCPNRTGRCSQTLDQLPAADGRSSAVDRRRAGACAAVPNETLASVDGLVGGANDAPVTKSLTDLQATLVATRTLGRSSWPSSLTRSGAPVVGFAQGGLPELQGLIQDSNRAVGEVSRTVRDLRQDPARFLFGNPAAEGVKLNELDRPTPCSHVAPARRCCSAAAPACWSAAGTAPAEYRLHPEIQLPDQAAQGRLGADRGRADRRRPARFRAGSPSWLEGARVQPAGRRRLVGPADRDAAVRDRADVPGVRAASGASAPTATTCPDATCCSRRWTLSSSSPRATAYGRGPPARPAAAPAAREVAGTTHSPGACRRRGFDPAPLSPPSTPPWVGC